MRQVGASRSGAWFGAALLGLSWAGAAGAATERVEACATLATTLSTYCHDDNIILIKSGLDCAISVVSLTGDCTITTDQPCGASITNGSTFPAIFAGAGKVTFDALSLSCDDAYSTNYLISASTGTTTFTNTCLDGSACTTALTGGDSETALPGVVRVDRSLLVGPVVSLPGGASQLTATNSIISVQDIERGVDSDPASVLYGEGVDQVDISLSAILASGDAVPAITLSGTPAITLTNNAVFVSGDAPALDITDSTLTVRNNTLFGDGDTGAAFQIEDSALSLARNLFSGFSLAISNTLSTVASDQDLWVNVTTATEGGDLTVTSLSAEDAGLTALPVGEEFCFLPPQCETSGCAPTYELCLESSNLWPADGCSALVLTTEDGGFDDLVGLVGGLSALSEAPPDSPPWTAVLGDDGDGDGWVDDLDWAPADESSHKPSWYRVESDECFYADNTCEDARPAGYAWTEYTLGTPPEDCPPRPDDCDTATSENDTDCDTPCLTDCDTGGPYIDFGSDCGQVTKGALFLLPPALILALRRRRRARR